MDARVDPIELACGVSLALLVGAASFSAWGVGGLLGAGSVAGFACVRFMRSRRSELARVQELRREAVEALMHGQMKSQFLASMSHEIRNPMNGILGMVEVLLESELSTDQRDCVQTLQRSAQGLMLILNDILDFSKIEAGTLELDSSEVKPLDWIESVAELHYRTAFDKGVEFAYYLDQSVPEVVMGDELRLRQVLTNLISNAIKFTSEGSVKIEITAVEREEGEWLRFSVTDSGIGIAPEDQRRLFLPFSQATAQTAQNFGGTGLGLAISSELVGLMGGAMSVDSVLGEGSTFWFEVPLKRVSATGITAPTLDQHRVLIVDDSEVRIDVIRRTLEGWGMQVQVATDLVTTLSCLRTAQRNGAPINLAIVDLDVNEGLGREVANRIKTDQTLRTTQLVAMNVLGRTVRPGSLARSGFDAWLSKPISPIRLRAALVHLIAEQSDQSLIPQEVIEELEAEEIILDDTVLDVLLVEDNVVNQRVASFLLQREGCRVDVASDGEQALEAFSQGAYDVIFMDCQMPVMNGFQATRAIRKKKEGQAVPIIAMTAQAMPGDRERCLAEGMNDYLCKPVQSDELKRVLAEWGGFDRVDAADQALTNTMMKDDEVLDSDVIDSLRELGGEDDPELLAELVGLFLSDTPKRIDELLTAVASDDLQGMERAAHALKSSAANLGAMNFSELFRSIESAGRSEDMETARPLVARCQGEFQSVEAALRELI